MKLMKMFLVFGFLVGVMELAAAAETTTTMNVSATVVNNCSISATDLVFGDYTGVIDVDSSFTVSATCTDSSPAWLSDDGGLNPDEGTFRRQMSGPDGGVVQPQKKAAIQVMNKGSARARGNLERASNRVP